MLSPLFSQPAALQHGLQPVWLLSRTLLSRSPRAAVLLAAVSSEAAPYKKEHLVWEAGFGSQSSVFKQPPDAPGWPIPARGAAIGASK